MTMSKIIVRKGKAYVVPDMELNIIHKVNPRVVEEIMMLIYGEQWQLCIHVLQSGAKLGDELITVTINGQGGWFKPTDKGLNSQIDTIPCSPQVTSFMPPEPTPYTTSQPKSSLSFLTRLFTFR